jgi:hypothetical protein
MSTSEHPRTWTLARHRLAADIPATVFLWVLFTLAVALLVGVVSAFTSIRISGWEQASQIPRWFAGGTGVYLTYFHLPLYVAYGYTRREFAAQAPVVVAAISGLLALLMSSGYLLEKVVYGVAGWSHTLTRSHLFTAPDQFWLVLAEFVLVFLVWTGAGAMLGAAFYRNAGLGMLLIPVALLMVGLIEYGLGDGIGPMPFGFLRGLLRPLAAIDATSVGAAFVICATALAVGLALTWVVIRDMPLRTRPA